MKEDKIISRIKKLLAMGEHSGSNENEAAIAMERAYKLMAKHNIDRATLSDDDVEEFGKDYFIRKRGGPWARNICHGIAKLYFCTYYYQGGKARTDSHFFVGTEANIAIAQMASNFIMDVIDGEAKRTAISNVYETKTQYLNSFRNSASKRIYSRCMEMVKEAETGTMKDDSGTNLPVLASLYRQHSDRASEYLNAQGTTLRTKAIRSRSSSSRGVGAGSNAGNRVNLRPSIR